MSFSFFKQSRPRTPQELAKAIKDSLVALDSKTVAEVKALEKVNTFLVVLEINELHSMEMWYICDTSGGVLWCVDYDMVNGQA